MFSSIVLDESQILMHVILNMHQQCIVTRRRVMFDFLSAIWKREIQFHFSNLWLNLLAYSTAKLKRFTERESQKSLGLFSLVILLSWSYLAYIPSNCIAFKVTVNVLISDILRRDTHNVWLANKCMAGKQITAKTYAMNDNRSYFLQIRFPFL